MSADQSVGFAGSSKQSSLRSKFDHTVVYLRANYPSCPPGLEKLIQADHLFVRQGMREQEPPYKLISKQKFEVLNGKGERIFLAKESTDNILKLCCRGGCGQPFEMSIKDRHSGYEILAVNGHPDCYGAMEACISQNGMSLGFVNEELRCCSSNYIVIDAQGNEIFRIYDVGCFPKSAAEKEVPSIRSLSHSNREGVVEGRNDENNHKNPEIRNNNNHEEEANGTSGGGSANRGTFTLSPCTSNNPLDNSNLESVTTTKDYSGEAGTSQGSTSHSRESATSAMNPQQIMPDDKRNGANNTIDTDLPESRDDDVGVVVGTNTTNITKRPKKPKSCFRGVGKCLDSCVSLISGGVEYEIYSCELGVVIGRVKKQWEELYDEYFNLVDCLGVNFPREMSVRHKSLILGALFILDFNHYQI